MSNHWIYRNIDNAIKEVDKAIEGVIEDDEFLNTESKKALLSPLNEALRNLKMVKR